MTSANGVAPHGNRELISLIVDTEKKEELKKESIFYPSWNLTPRQLCDLELLINGAFTPLKGFMNKADYESVVSQMRLSGGLLWPIPIVLDVDEEFIKGLGLVSKIALRDQEGNLIAVLTVEDVWRPDRVEESELVYQTTDLKHPGVDFLINQVRPWYVGGSVEGIEPPKHYDFKSLRHTPRDLREIFQKNQQKKIVAFQTRNPMHRAHKEITTMAAQQIGGDLLLHPVVGQTKFGDISYYTRVKCYQALLSQYREINHVTLSLLPLSMRMAGPREALWHGIIRQNYGCSHFIIGRDHASPGAPYGPYDAQEMFQKYQKELNIQMVCFNELVYVEEEKQFLPKEKVPKGKTVLSFSGTELRRRLVSGLEIPHWFTFPEVLQELRAAYPTRAKQGVTIFFTGLSGAGKSTLARALQIKLLENDQRPVTLLDGDVVRKYLSSELGFSKAHRNLNILRIGFVATEITKNRGIAICAPIAPYEDVRREVQKTIETVGGFVLVHVATPLETCEERDPKGLYAKARKGKIPEFTGISDPYEVPENPHLTIDTSKLSPEEGVEIILSYLKNEGYLIGEGSK